MIDREDLDTLARDLLGRPLTATEHRDLLPTIVALRLASGSPVLVLLVLYQALRTEIAAATALRARRRRAARLRGIALGIALGLGCASLGYGTATRQSLRELDPAIRWTLSEEGARARAMSDSGLLEALERCAIPGWEMRESACVPGPDPVTGTTHGIVARPRTTP